MFKKIFLISAVGVAALSSLQVDAVVTEVQTPTEHDIGQPSAPSADHDGIPSNTPETTVQTEGENPIAIEQNKGEGTEKTGDDALAKVEENDKGKEEKGSDETSNEVTEAEKEKTGDDASAKVEENDKGKDEKGGDETSNVVTEAEKEKTGDDASAKVEENGKENKGDDETTSAVITEADSKSVFDKVGGVWGITSIGVCAAAILSLVTFGLVRRSKQKKRAAAAAAAYRNRVYRSHV